MSLVFDARDTMRRLGSYPANWHELSDEELLALSLAAVLQQPRVTQDYVGGVIRDAGETSGDLGTFRSGDL